jgi:16S rRNA (guanine527-N7)-methyltransferase
MDWSPELRQAWHAALKVHGLLPLLSQQAHEELLARYGQFYEALIAYNQKVNLTRITDPKDFLYRHLLDSLFLLSYIPEGAHVVDVGSGAGFPAIPLAMARSDLQVTAVESVGKKCKFIQSIQEEFQLGNRLTVLNARSEELGRMAQYREQFDVATARAVSSLPVLLEYCLPLVRVQGKFLALKGPSYEKEIMVSKSALASLGGAIISVKPFYIQEQSHSVVIEVQKVKATPPGLPRATALMAKKSL